MAGAYSECARANYPGFKELAGLCSLFVLQRLRLVAVRDLNPTRPQSLGHFAHEVDGQQAIRHPRVPNLHLIRKAEPLLERDRGDTAIQVSLAFRLGLVARHDQQVRLGHDRDLIR